MLLGDWGPCFILASGWSREGLQEEARMVDFAMNPPNFSSLKLKSYSVLVLFFFLNVLPTFFYQINFQ
jgi:hypothetical protein